MSETSRRNLLKGTAVAGIAAALGVTIKPETLAAEADSQKHQHSTINGPLANATVSFGAWPAPAEPPLGGWIDLQVPEHRLFQTYTNSYLTKSRSKQADR